LTNPCSILRKSPNACSKVTTGRVKVYRGQCVKAYEAGAVILAPNVRAVVSILVKPDLTSPAMSLDTSTGAPPHALADHRFVSFMKNWHPLATS